MECQHFYNIFTEVLRNDAPKKNKLLYLSKSEQFQEQKRQKSHNEKIKPTQFISQRESREVDKNFSLIWISKK